MWAQMSFYEQSTANNGDACMSEESNSIGDPLKAIREYGDLLERHMFEDQQFADHFSLYPRVWADYVLPHREPNQPSLITPQWMPLAQHHYSAIVRCWTMHKLSKRIEATCFEMIDRPSEIARILLDLQECLVTFFCSAGGAIDNLRGTYRVQPIGSDADFQKLYEDKEQRYSLAWVFERRNQTVHKTLLPCFEKDGLPYFDESLFADLGVAWNRAKKRDFKCVAEMIERVWQAFIARTRAVWSRMYELLKQKSLVQRPVAVTIFTHCNLSSASPPPSSF
jgi:hypothetical protein